MVLEFKEDNIVKKNFKIFIPEPFLVNKFEKAKEISPRLKAIFDNKDVRHSIECSAKEIIKMIRAIQTVGTFSDEEYLEINSKELWIDAIKINICASILEKAIIGEFINSTSWDIKKMVAKTIKDVRKDYVLEVIYDYTQYVLAYFKTLYEEKMTDDFFDSFPGGVLN